MMHSLRLNHRQKQRLLPVVDASGRLVGVIARSDIQQLWETEGEQVLSRPLGELARKDAVLAYPDEPLRVVVYRVAESTVTRMPVVERGTGKLLGLVSLEDLLKARARHAEEERRREQTLTLRFLFPGAPETRETQTPVDS